MLSWRASRRSGPAERSKVNNEKDSLKGNPKDVGFEVKMNKVLKRSNFEL